MKRELFNDAVINDSISFKIDFSEVQLDAQNEHQFDAIYIPSLGLRENLLKVVEKVSKYANEIVIIFSGFVPDWIINFSPNNVRIVSNVESVISFERLKSIKSSKNPSLAFMDDYDLPLKRNYALLDSRVKGYEVIGLIDDDMVFTELDIIKAMKCLSSYADMVGYYVLDYPDVSTIDHIERFINQHPSKVSIGGNFLFFKMDKITGFFPYLYNEDWCFIFSNLISNINIYVCGFVNQLVHEPWKNYNRIAFEQFGDVVITGFKQLLANRCDIFNEEIFFWHNIYENYKDRLENLLAKTKDLEFISVLQHAIICTSTFSPDDILQFVKHYKSEISQNCYV
ncbi:hypothetical protein [Fibrella arboris]|uniref:hypothetical protein n=1 Tax=Fibrella arboris TaxID=3242486 RepID=UPI00352104B4